MKTKISLSALVILLVIQVNLSCKKVLSCESCNNRSNKPPIALAGPDQVITLPTDSVLLDGNASSDPDGTISDWLWTKISGPAFFMINNVAASKIIVKNLAGGFYQVELKVTDSGGLTARDTVSISVIDPGQPNRPPVADAGPDQSVVLPESSISVDGSGSADPDNNIASYLWTKISGPPAFEIITGNSVQSQITNLEEGMYGFELKVSDAGGLFSKDTICVMVKKPAPPTPCDNSNRPKVMARLVPAGTLSSGRGGMAVASAGNIILYAGGADDGSPASNVEIYDMVSQTSTPAKLTVARYDMAAVAAGNKIFFGGGEIGDGTWPSNTVDIYDVVTNTWSASVLSAAGNSVAAAAVGNKVFFAGGDPGFSGSNGLGRSRRVDIYDLNTNTWSTASLSEDKIGATAVTAYNKIYFAGGGTWTRIPNQAYGVWIASDKIDIYDNATDTWSTASMKEGKVGFAGISFGDKIYWAGGSTGSSVTSVQTSCVVEVMDVNTGSSLMKNLYAPASWWNNSGQNAVIKNNKIVFCRPNEPDSDKFDIYDIGTATWSIGVLTQPLPTGSSIISVNNTIYIAGGSINGVLSNKVSKLEF